MTRPLRTDESLLAAWSQGDQAALTVLFERYREPLTAYAWRMVRRREVAEELCIEAFCRLTAERPTGLRSFRGWLFTVVHRLSIDAIRRQGRASSAHLKLVDGGPSPSTPEDAALADERRGALERAIGQLAEKHRSVLLLYYGQDLSSQEVAGILGLQDHQVRSRLSYARRKLRELMETGEEVCA